MAKLSLLILTALLSGYCHSAIDLLVYNYPPLVEIRSDSELSGRSVNLITRLFSQARVPYTFTQQPPRRALYKTSRHEESCTFPVDRTQDREPRYLWIGPVSVSRYAFYANPDNPIPLTTLSDAKKYNIAVFAGSGIAEYLSQNGFKTFETNNIEQGLRMLKHGRVDLWAADTHSAKSLSGRYDLANLQPSLTFFTTISFMACNLAMPEEIHQSLISELKKMYLTGQAQELLNLDF